MTKTYTLEHTKAQSFHRAPRISELLASAAEFIAKLEGDSGTDVVVVAITPGYDEEMNPYVNVYYEAV